MNLRRFFTSTLVGCALIAAIAGSGCARLYTGELEGNNFKFPIDPQTIPGSGLPGQIINVLGLDFPFEAVIPGDAPNAKEITEIYLNQFAFRSTRADDFDLNHKAIEKQLMRENIVLECATNQKNLSFIKTLEIFLQKEGSTAAPIRIAHYTKPANAPANVCGFMMELDMDPATGKTVNLKQFMPHYTASTKATGSAPSVDTEITGFVSVDWVAPDSAIPGTPPPQN